MGLENLFQFGKVEHNIGGLRSIAQDAYGEDQLLELEIKKLNGEFRRNPEKVFEKIQLLEEAIAYEGRDPQTQGRCFHQLANCFLARAACKADFDHLAARILLHGTDAGRKSLNHMGCERGYDGAFDAIRKAKELLPGDRSVLKTEKMLKLLDRQLSPPSLSNGRRTH